MSEKFNGFSQDEIKKVSVQSNQKKTSISTQSNAATNKQAFRPHRDGIMRVTDKMTNKNLAKKQQVDASTKQASSNTVPNVNTENVLGTDSLDDINLDASISRSIEEALFFRPEKKPNGTENGQDDKKLTTNYSTLAFSGKDVTRAIEKIVPCLELEESSTVSDSTTETDITTNALNLESPFKGISLKDFETHRRMIQEQNKQKKELLHKAIEQYSQKTAAEARKIEEIKTELSKLDNDLALDVSILRKQIDMACMHFANMEKQYMKIESQFLKAKIELHNAAEKKELLTEHLCTVIAHNEDRKAQKLSELMQKVGLSPDKNFEAEEQEMNSNTPDK